VIARIPSRPRVGIFHVSMGCAELKPRILTAQVAVGRTVAVESTTLRMRLPTRGSSRENVEKRSLSLTAFQPHLREMKITQNCLGDVAKPARLKPCLRR